MAKRVTKVPGGNGTAPPSEDGSRVISGYESDIDELVRLHGEIEQAERRIAAIRVKLDAVADAAHCEIEARTGRQCKQVQIKGNSVNGRYTFANRYHVIDRGCIPDLRKMLGGHFDALFRTTEDVALKRDAASRLLVLMREQGKADEYFSVDPRVAPIDDFRAIRASLRGSLSKEANEALDNFVREMANKPSFSLK